MSTRNFLSAFIKEEIYLIDRNLQDSTNDPAEMKCLIVVPGPLSMTDTTFLHKVFAAVDIKPALLEVSETQISAHPARTTFYFGGAPPHSNLEHYQCHKIDGAPVVLAHALSEIAGDNGLKRKLWSVLKDCFS